MKSLRKPKLFRDPIHDIIALDPETWVGDTLMRLLGAREFQRLRRIKQLGLAYMVYPGAEHSRFSHSLGVLHIAGRMLGQVAFHVVLSPEERFRTLAAALLHDIGHGPFSHAIEKTTEVKHEAITIGLLMDPDSEVHQLLTDIDPAMPEQVAHLVDGHQPRSCLSDIVSSQLDADRLDYILRDGHMTGVKIGVYDIERILSMLEAEDDYLVVNGRAKEAVEGYLLARFHMFKQVYLHKSARAAEAMLEAALGRAAELVQADVPLPMPDGPLRRLLSGERLAAVEFAELDDMDIWVALKGWATAADATLAELAHGLLHRRLYKTVDLDTAPGAVRVAVDRATDAVAAAGLDPRYHLRVAHAEDTPYRPYDPGASARQRPIMINVDGTLRRIEEISDIAHLLGRDRYTSVRLCFPERARATVMGALSASDSP